ncbi:MAG: DUF3570 domain-containing protein [Myxococcales bacterium]|jgi:hypothetical protein
MSRRLYRTSPRARIALAFASLGCALPWTSMAVAQEAAASLYVRNDSDRTTVITPRARVDVPVGEDTSVGLVYMVDVWTSASVDIRTSASRRISGSDFGARRVTEQRDEIDVGLGHDLHGVRLTGEYRYSTEPDYESHGGAVGAEIDLANKSALLAVTARANFDRVGRAGAPDFQRPVDVLGGRVAFTQILDPQTLVQGIYELASADGYLSSPYRYVGVGTDDSTCRVDGDDDELLYCVPENNPEGRLSHALALRGRRALGGALSVGAGYRFYVDDWELSSHTVQVDLAWALLQDSLLTLRYRFYTQGEAYFFERAYLEERDDGLYTRDKELSPLDSHRVGLDLERRFELGGSGERLKVVLGLGGTHYTYDDYALLDSVTALEATLATVLEL